MKQIEQGCDEQSSLCRPFRNQKGTGLQDITTHRDAVCRFKLIIEMHDCIFILLEDLDYWLMQGKQQLLQNQELQQASVLNENLLSSMGLEPYM